MKESAFQSEPRVPESVIRHASTSPAEKAKVTISEGKGPDEEKPKKSSLCRNVEGCREELQSQVLLSAAKQRWVLMRILGRLGWLSAELLDFYDERDHKGVSGFKKQLMCSSHQEHLVPHLPDLFVSCRPTSPLPLWCWRC